MSGVVFAPGPAIPLLVKVEEELDDGWWKLRDPVSLHVYAEPTSRLSYDKPACIGNTRVQVPTFSPRLTPAEAAERIRAHVPDVDSLDVEAHLAITRGTEPVNQGPIDEARIIKEITDKQTLRGLLYQEQLRAVGLEEEIASLRDHLSGELARLAVLIELAKMALSTPHNSRAIEGEINTRLDVLEQSHEALRLIVGEGVDRG